MLKNSPTLAIGGVDTAENGPSKVRQVTNKVCRNIGLHDARMQAPECLAAPWAGRARLMTGGGYRLLASANFGELVLGCIRIRIRSRSVFEKKSIDAKFCK